MSENQIQQPKELKSNDQIQEIKEKVFGCLKITYQKVRDWSLQKYSQIKIIVEAKLNKQSNEVNLEKLSTSAAQEMQPQQPQGTIQLNIQDLTMNLEDNLVTDDGNSGKNQNNGQQFDVLQLNENGEQKTDFNFDQSMSIMTDASELENEK